MQKILEFLRQIPLVAVLAVTGLLLTGVALVCKDTAYADYETESFSRPFLSIVMEGIHDGVYPWSGGGDGDPAAEAGSTAATAEAVAAAEESPESAKENGGQEAPEETEEKENAEEKKSADQEKKDEEAAPEEKKDEEKTSEEEDGKEEVEEEKKESETEEKGKREKSDAAKRIEEAARQAEAKDALVEEVEAQVKAVEESETAPLDKPLDPLPENVCNKVVGAKDYGNADSYFMSPDDTLYNTDTEGMFARGEVTYTLGETDDSYFEDALFIGDSRTSGLAEYGNMMDHTSFMSRESASIYALFSSKMDFREPGSDVRETDLYDVLSARQYGKIYLSVGVNELGIGNTYGYYELYRRALIKIRVMQPEAIIYIQGSMHVSEAVAKKDKVTNNTIIVQRNKAIATLANGYNIFYIDMNTAVCDKNGNLIADYSGDGVHLKASKYELWHESLLQNAVSR
ncbi:MAG: hypothetical protein IK087_07470 [Lachnospiraceae bacterium]|nr:hypothetical protein [Lachnospiraceae bacterium]